MSRTNEEIYLKQHDSLDVSWLSPLRLKGASRFAKLGFPQKAHEEWRKSDLSFIRDTEYMPVAEANFESGQRVRPSSLPGSIELNLVGGRLDTANGVIDDLPPGLKIVSLNDTTGEEGICRHLDTVADPENPFAAMNSAFLGAGVLIELDSKCKLTRPIVLNHLIEAYDRPVHAQIRVLLVAGAFSSGKLVENYEGGAGGGYFSNSVTELVVGDGATVDYCRIQNEEQRGIHVSGLYVEQGKDSSFISHDIGLGALRWRQDIHVKMKQSGGECQLDGLYLGAVDQYNDIHTLVEHQSPNCVSDELYKGILSDRSRAVFKGKVVVHSEARNTVSSQSNATLLLSERAKINTEPHLVINNDEVKCSHGATIGRLDENQIEYLVSRGIHPEDARAMLLAAFASEAVAKLRIPQLRDQIEELMIGKYGAKG